MKYDVAIIGAGPAGIFAAYELISKNPNLDIAIFEQGDSLNKRKCPILEKKVQSCINCKSCAIMRGFGGAGAFSDGKYNFTTEFGGWLNDYLSNDHVMELINYVDKINCHYGAPSEVFSTYTEKAIELEKKALSNGLHLLQASVRHLGTENNYKILEAIYNFLIGQKNINIFFDTEVAKFWQTEDKDFKIETGNKTVIESQYLVVAPGRAGSEWFTGQCKNLGLTLLNNQVDVGVRVELPAKTFEHITDIVYEAKFKYRTERYEDIVRTFCMNPNGYVVTENTDGIITVNGHSYSDPALGSKNTNFALLVSNKFTEPFDQPHQYGKRIASFSNMLGGGVIVQRFEDLVKGRRTNESRLMKSFTKPTLNATPGDLSLVLPKRQMDNIIEMIYALDKIAPGTANGDTLLYGVEVKFYSARLKLTNELETEIPNLFAIGDGAGVTRGLSQAAASGIHIARTIQKRI